MAKAVKKQVASQVKKVDKPAKKRGLTQFGTQTGKFPTEVAKLLVRQGGATKVEINSLAKKMGEPVPYKNLKKLRDKMEEAGYETGVEIVEKDNGVKVRRYYAKKASEPAKKAKKS